MEQEKQFDVTLGGSVHLPHTIALDKYLPARAEELKTLKNATTISSGTKLAFQTLPKHMRRRAMSHNVKRLPRRLKEKHLNQMKKSGMPSKLKRPSRKYRRRPGRLMEDHQRRVGGKLKWLQTHVWHAKRFHMTEKWGYKLPSHPCDKAFRACYRASAEHCLLQDISYVQCVELKGNKDVIIQQIKQITRDNGTLSVGAKVWANGRREGKLVLYEYNTVPDKAIGSVNFHWESAEGQTHKLWLWIHVAFYAKALETLINCFSLDGFPGSHINTWCELPTFANTSSGIVLRELKHELSRFRLTGPLATCILQEAFVLTSESDFQIPWLREFIEKDPIKEVVKEHFDEWKSIKNISCPSTCNPHVIFSLIVKDPRTYFPEKRIKVVPDPDFEEGPNYFFPSCTNGSNPIWCEKYRKISSESKVTDVKLNELRSGLLVPGTSVENKAFIPVLVIQRPGDRNIRLGFGSGWDIVFPTAWAKPFWMSFIMRGARVGGLRETDSLMFEMSKSHFLAPDTEAGCEQERQTTKELLDTFFKKPPNKRINFNKFRIASPFSYNWKLLIEEWKSVKRLVDDFYVVRNTKVLQRIQQYLECKNNDLPDCSEDSLVPIKLVCLRKGPIKDFAVVCLPTTDDFKAEPVEKTCSDKLEQKRRQLRTEHVKLLKKLRKWRKTKKNMELDENEKQASANYFQTMRDLWLPEPTTLRNSCSREVMGFVKKGGFSFSIGGNCGIGYIALGALPALQNSTRRNVILFRNTNSRQYRRAKVSVVIEE